MTWTSIPTAGSRSLTCRRRGRGPALEALWRLDVTFAAILAAGREPMVSRLRLAWWREALEALDAGDAAGRAAAPGAGRTGASRWA